MNILIIGSGGRESAIAWKLEKSTQVSKIFIAPGNGGTTGPKLFGTNTIIQSPDFHAIVQFAVDNRIKLVIPGPEQVLVDGIESAFKKVGIACFGPSKEAAQLEGSKIFSKSFMVENDIPTAEYKSFDDFEKAKTYIEHIGGQVVIKVSGLAAGKGVFLPDSIQDAIQSLKDIMIDHHFGSAGSQVIIEEKLVGEEVSCLAFCDGYTLIPLPGAQDHKRIHNGDLGPNTGGMGCYAPAPIYTPKIAEVVKNTILQPTIDAMRKRGTPYIGILYAGIMLTSTGPKCLEFNCRFGDPETQVLLPLLSDSCDLLTIMLASTGGYLDSIDILIKNEFACAVVAASDGYPGSYQTDLSIQVPKNIGNALIFHAGTKIVDGILVTSGGRVLSITAIADTLEKAIEESRVMISQIQFEGIQYRTDIGYKALQLTKSKRKGGSTYAEAGVSIDTGNQLIEIIKPFVKATSRCGAEADIGGFGGVFDLKAAGYVDPILVSGTDGVGTKLKIAQMVGKHDTIGIDLVAMSVNDVLVQGAEPLFFLDYFASSKLDVLVAAAVVKGIARGCIESGCALIGGETAEMPGIYQNGEYDLAGFVVGAVNRSDILPRLDDINEGDVLLGLASSGAHSNGYSLIRHIISQSGLSYSSPCPFENPVSQSLGEALLTPTKLYVKQLLPVIKAGLIKSMVHITGGGFIDNIPRSLPKKYSAILNAASWPLLPIFSWVKKAGNISDLELARTFNCGIGMVLVANNSDVRKITELLHNSGEFVYEIGRVAHHSEGEERVHVLNMNIVWDK